MRKRFVEKTRDGRLGRLALLCLLAALCVAVSALASGWSEKGRQESARVIEEGVARAAVQCYALEGRYPPDLDYLAEHYGVDPEPRGFVIYYDRFASNLMPEITVVRKTSE